MHPATNKHRSFRILRITQPADADTGAETAVSTDSGIWYLLLNNQVRQSDKIDFGFVAKISVKVKLNLVVRSATVHSSVYTTAYTTVLTDRYWQQ